MADAKELVRFGLKNAYYAKWDPKTSKYLAPVKAPGIVAISLSPEGDSTTFYAEDRPYFSVTANGGYTGSMEIANVTDDMYVDLLGYVKDANGALIEDASATPASFALLFEVDSNIEPARFVLYSCTIARPSEERKTKESSIDVNTQTMDLTAIARSIAYGDGTIDAVKGHLALTDASKTAYDSFFTEVYMPKKVAA